MLVDVCDCDSTTTIDDDVVLLIGCVVELEDVVLVRSVMAVASVGYLDVVLLVEEWCCWSCCASASTASGRCGGRERAIIGVGHWGGGLIGTRF